MEEKNTTLARYCYYCGKKFIALHGRIIFCCEFCNFKNWKETQRKKSLRQARKNK